MIAVTGQHRWHDPSEQGVFADDHALLCFDSHRGVVACLLG